MPDQKYKLSPATAERLKEAYRKAGFQKVEPADWTIHIVDKLPWPIRGGFSGCVLGHNHIYIVAKVNRRTLDDVLSNSRVLLCHEGIHQDQIGRHGWYGFLTRYLFQWLKDGRDYRKIDFEEEAYGKQAEVAAGWV
jgi:hypothetical protein